MTLDSIRERRKYLFIVGTVVGVFLAGSLGYVFAYDNTQPTVIGENLLNVQNLGSSSNPLEEINTEQASIAKRPKDYSHTIFSDENYIYAIDREGNIIAGGEDAKNVSDATDFAEIYAYVVNNTVPNPSIRVAQAPYYTSVNDGTNINIPLVCKSQQSLTKAHSLWGAGLNRGSIIAGSEVDGMTVFNFKPVSGVFIFRLDSLKFEGEGYNEYADIYYDTDKVTEVFITNCEFRDTKTRALDIDDCGGYNYIGYTHFLGGAGFSVDNANDLRIIGNKLNTANGEVLNSDDVIPVGNIFTGGASINYSNCTFQPVRADQITAIESSIDLNNDLNLQNHDILNWVKTQNLQGGLQGFWGIEANTGTSAYDSSPNSNTGTLNSTATASDMWEIDSEKGVVLNFAPADNEYVNVPHDSSISSEQLTVCFWLYYPSGQTDYTVFLSKKSDWGSANEGWAIGVNTDALYTKINDDTESALNLYGSDESGSWIFVTLRLGSDYELIVNTNVVASLSSLGGSITNIVDLKIAEMNNNFTDCKIKNVRYYDRALSDEEIKALYLNFGRQPTAHI